MKFVLITLFPDYFEMSLRQSLLGKALQKQLFEIEILNLRDFATDKHRTVDDTPYGGGGGMVLKLEPLDRCLQSLGYSHRSSNDGVDSKDHILLTSAAGMPFTQKKAVELSLSDRLTVICGHYLGVDERITQLYELEEISIGDYVLTGGEPAAAVIVDAVARLIPKVLGNFESALDDSYMDQILGTPCYTRPAEYAGLNVPSELTAGDHKQIKQFKRTEAMRKSLANRPDLLASVELTENDRHEIEKSGNRFDNNNERKR